MCKRIKREFDLGIQKGSSIGVSLKEPRGTSLTGWSCGDEVPGHSNQETWLVTLVRWNRSNSGIQL